MAILHVFLIAGEPSGDLIGARLMAALRRKLGDHVRFSGIGGPQMGEEGLSSLFPFSELAVMGVFEVLPKVRSLLARMRQTARAVEEAAPDILVTIDSPAFAFGVVRRLGNRTVPRVHYVAPTVWAWRPWRVHKFARAFDHILALLPFEPPYFEKAGLACSFVGHPVLEGGADNGDGPAFRETHDIDKGATLLCVLPGSRLGEVNRLLGCFGDAVARLGERRKDLVVVVPTLPHVAEGVRKATDTWPVRVVLIEETAARFDAMAASDVALAASGTVALELAMARVPTVIGYKVAPLTAMVLRRMVRVRFVSLVNLLVDRAASPELLQENCEPKKLGDALELLLSDPARRQDVMDAEAEALLSLGLAGPRPSERAADVVCRLADVQDTSQ
ncbi:MAG: lipid-A-disaccharide synthase [Alphaproteobacteria bacterium]